MLKKLFVFCAVFITILLSDYNNITLQELLKKTAFLNNINIIYPDFNLSKRYTFTINNFISAKDLLKASEALLKRNGYILTKLNKSFYMVAKIDDKRHNYIYRIKNSNANQILSHIQGLYPNSVFKLNNSLLLVKYSSSKELKELLHNIKLLDISRPGYFITINIYAVNTDKLHQLGINLNNANNPSSILIKPHLSLTPILITFLNDKKYSKLIASPKLFLAPDANNTATFKQVTTVPITIKKTQIIPGTNPVVTNTSNTIYKDVGLIMQLQFINTTKDNRVKFKLNLTDSNIISYTQTGITSSNRTIQAVIQAKLNQPVFIAGLSKTTKTKHRVGVPILEDLPLIKYLVSTEKTETQNKTLVITVLIKKAK